MTDGAGAEHCAHAYLLVSQGKRRELRACSAVSVLVNRVSTLNE
jgi:hypothetical protein